MLNKSSLKTFQNIFLLFSLALLTFSCIQKPNNQPTEIRIVDLNGKAKPIKRIVPEGNAQILKMQDKEMPENNHNVNIDSDLEPANKVMADNSLSQNNQNPTTIQKDLAEQNNNDKTIASNMPFEATVSYDMSEDDNTNKDETNANDTSKIKNDRLSDNSLSQQTSQPNKKFKFITTKTKVISNDSDIASGNGKIFIQIGFFSSSVNADNVLAKSKKISSGSIREISINGQSGYKVFLGPISNHKKAIEILTKAKKSGYRDAFIVK